MTHVEGFQVTVAKSDLVSRLLVELFQTEESACKHPRIEAARLGGSPPGKAMLAVKVHAQRVLPEIDRLSKAEDLETASMGRKIGDAFSVVRDLVVDRTMSREKSYRSTLLGLRHGLDLVRLLFASARADGRDQIVTFCQAWLEERTPLVEAAASQLDWFGANPNLALESATDHLGKRLDSRPGRRQNRAHETSIIPRRRR